MSLNPIYYAQLIPIFFISFLITAQEADVNEIITKSILDTKLYEGTSFQPESFDTFFVLNHGFDVTISDGLLVNGTPLTLIDKSELSAMGDTPYFLIHTFNIEDKKALVRLYLSFKSDGEERTTNTELLFTKNNTNWTLISPN